MSLRLQYAVRSDRGLVRNNNEDSVYAGPRLLAIADGMGGHAAGEIASKIVIGTLEPLDEDRPINDLIGAVRDSVAEANAAIAESVEHDPDLEGMGTTLTAIRFAGSRIAVVHVGDSRAYLLRSGQLSQITHDDTYVQSLVDSGKLTPEEASHHPRKSVILRALTGSDVEPDISIREARRGDRYLLCSDGLSDVVTASTMLEALSEGSPHSCADRLIELALRGGGPDNVTCIVADVVDDSDGDDLPVIAGAVMDPADAVDSRDDSPASRAAKIGREARPAPVAAAPRHMIRRRLLISGVVAAFLVAAAAAGYLWTQSQFFVGRDGDEVALFRGVNADFGPISLYSVVENSSLRVDDLTPAAQGQVNSGITARSRADGEQILARLSGNVLPICPSVSPSPSGTSTALVSRTPAKPPTSSKTVSAKPTVSAGKSAATATKSSASHSAAVSSPRSTPTAVFTPVPGQTPSCRKGP